MTAKTSIQPLRAIAAVTSTGRAGSEITPHAFWLTQEFELRLACGHTQLRTSCNFKKLPHEELFGKRARCTQCPATKRSSRSRKPRPTPTHDPLAAALTGQLVRLAGDRQDAALAWVTSSGAWIDDPVQRRKARAAAALAVARHHASLEPDDSPCRELVDDFLTAFQAVVDHGGEEQVADMVRLRKRIYPRQHSFTCWLAARGLNSAGSACSSADHVVVKSVLESIGWLDDGTVSARYNQAWKTRHRFDLARDTDLMSAMTQGDVIRKDTTADVERARADLEAAVSDALDRRLSPWHVPVLLDAMAAFGAARTGMES